MRFAITAVFCLFLGTTVSSYAAQEKGHEEHQQQARPEKQSSRPAPQQRQAQTPQRQQTQSSRPAQTTQATRAPQQQARPANGQTRRNAGQSQARNQGQQRNNGGHGRISDVHYRASFGSSHSFHVNRGEYDRRRFQYGGYSFGFVDPWPVAWGYSDDVYVVYADGGYYMYNRVHPGLRISVNIF